MTRSRDLELHHRRGWLQVKVDGETVINMCIFREPKPVGNAIRSGDLSGYTAWGQADVGGRSWWSRVSCSIRNRTLDDFDWSWEASSGLLPDHYQRERMIQIHGNHPDQKPGPDHGYSSWLLLDDGRIYFTDYTNYGDTGGNSHLVAAYIEPEDIA